MLMIIKKYYQIVICFLLLILCGSCVNVKPPITTFKKYDVSHINLVSANFDFIFDVENPNDIPLNIKSIEYVFYLEGKDVLNGTSKGFDLNARDKKEVLIPIEISYLGALESVAEIAKSLIIGNKKMAYKLEGNLIVESLGTSVRVPLKSEGELSLVK